MSADKEPFYFTKAASGFADVTRWGKDTFGTIRGLLALALVAAAIFGCVQLVKLWKKPAPPVQIETNSGHVETGSDKRTKIGLLNF